MRNEGFNAPPGSWGTYATTLPRRLRRARASRPRMLSPPMWMLPPRIRTPGRVKPSRASASVVLPLPDSPTTPRISPGATSKLTSSTTGSPLSSATVRFSTLIATPVAASLMRSRSWLRCDDAPHSARDVGAAEAARDCVAGEVDADREDGDHRRRCQHRERVQRDVLPVLADHQRPVGAGRVDSEPEIDNRRDDQDRVGEAQACIDEHGAEDVRQHLAYEHGGCALATC